MDTRLYKYGHPHTKLDREFVKNILFTQRTVLTIFQFWRPKCLSNLEIKLNKNCTVTVSPDTVKAAIHGDTMGAYRGRWNTTPLILNLHTTNRSAISFTPQYPLNSELTGPAVGWALWRKDLASPLTLSSQDHPTVTILATQYHSFAKTSWLCVDYGTVSSICNNLYKIPEKKFSFKSRLIMR